MACCRALRIWFITYATPASERARRKLGCTMTTAPVAKTTRMPSTMRTSTMLKPMLLVREFRLTRFAITRPEENTSSPAFAIAGLNWGKGKIRRGGSLCSSGVQAFYQFLWRRNRFSAQRDSVKIRRRQGNDSHSAHKQQQARLRIALLLYDQQPVGGRFRRAQLPLPIHPPDVGARHQGDAGHPRERLIEADLFVGKQHNAPRLRRVAALDGRQHIARFIAATDAAQHDARAHRLPAIAHPGKRVGIEIAGICQPPLLRVVDL